MEAKLLIVQQQRIIDGLLFLVEFFEIATMYYCVHIVFFYRTNKFDYKIVLIFQTNRFLKLKPQLTEFLIFFYQRF